MKRTVLDYVSVGVVTYTVRVLCLKAVSHQCTQCYTPRPKEV